MSNVGAARCFGSTSTTAMPMKAGTVLKNLGVFKGQDPPVVKERNDYPAWVGELAEPLPGLVKLRRVPNEEAEDKDVMRFLKLNRRLRIREGNEQAASKS